MSPSNKAWLSACEAGQGYSTSAEYLQLTTCCHSQPIPAPGVPPAWPGLASFTAEELGLKSPAQDSQLSVSEKPRLEPRADSSASLFLALASKSSLVGHLHSCFLDVSSSNEKQAPGPLFIPSLWMTCDKLSQEEGKGLRTGFDSSSVCIVISGLRSGQVSGPRLRSCAGIA